MSKMEKNYMRIKISEHQRSNNVQHSVARYGEKCDSTVDQYLLHRILDITLSLGVRGLAFRGDN